jgi:aldehyde dehydrogenase (NAD+)
MRWRAIEGIDHISFTGSPKVGTLIQQVAAERHCPVTLELGGKSPQIIFADADLDAAVPMVINAIVQNAGQTCSAGSRVLIEQAIYEPLLERLGKAFENLRVGPATMDLDVGPLIRQSQQQRVWDFLSDAQVANIPMVAQGQVVDEAPETGFYQAPTLLRDVPVDHRIAQEEVFGPVLSAMAFKDEDHAVAARQCHPVRPGGGHLDARWRAPVAHGQARAKRPGVHQQLRRRRRRGAAVWRLQVVRLWARKGL